jgi:UDP:flavonoid glycosyltransferase YjiC (YdhE family)
MAHIAMVGIPAPGHVNPSLEIIRALAARGHRVTYANDPGFADVVRGVGAELVPYTSMLPFFREESWDGDAIDGLTIFLDDVIAMLPQLRTAYEDDRPDLFLYDIGGAPARISGGSGGSRRSSSRRRSSPGRATSRTWRRWSTG